MCLSLDSCKTNMPFKTTRSLTFANSDSPATFGIENAEAAGSGAEVGSGAGVEAGLGSRSPNLRLGSESLSSKLLPSTLPAPAEVGGLAFGEGVGEDAAGRPPKDGKLMSGSSISGSFGEAGAEGKEVAAFLPKRNVGSF